MKLSFPDRISVGVSTTKQVESYISWLLVIVFVVGVGGSYLLGNRLISLAVIVLGIAGVAILTLVNWSKVDRTHSLPIKKKVPRIASDWHYRPKQAIRGYAAPDSPSAETSDVLSSERFETAHNIWFNDDSLECTAHTFVSDRAGRDVTARVLSPARERAVSGYD